MTLNLRITIGDDHKRNPLTAEFICKINIMAPTGGAVFDAESLLKNRIDKQKEVVVNLPPPVMTIGPLGKDSKVLISFSRPVGFKIPLRRIL